MNQIHTRKFYQSKTKNISLNTKALLALAFVSLIWGSTYLASKEGVRTMPALQLSGMRQCIAGSVFILYFIFKKAPWPKGKQWRTIGLMGMLNFFLSNGMSTWGIKFIPTGLSAIIAAIFPLWLVILLAFKGQKLPSKSLAGLLIGFSGICIIFYEHLKDFVNPDFRFGLFLSIAATISWTFGTLITKQQTQKFNPYFSLGFQMFFSGIALLLIVVSTNNLISVSEIPSNGWLALSYLVIFGSLLSFIAYVYVLKNLPATLVSIYAYINPIVAVLLGTLILNEKMTVFIAIGGAVAIMGVYLVNNGLRKKNIEKMIT